MHKARIAAFKIKRRAVGHLDKVTPAIEYAGVEVDPNG